MGSETRKKILLSEELDEATREKMKAIIEKRGGEIVTKEDEASHIVYGAPPKSANSDGTWFIIYKSCYNEHFFSHIFLEIILLTSISLLRNII